MKKLLVLLAISSLFFACDNEENTESRKHYGSTDTTKSGSVNSNADSAHTNDASHQ